MRKLKYILISSFVTILLIITVPIILISYTFLPYNNIYYSKEYYSSQDPTTIDVLNIDVDIGNVEISYIPYAVDFSIKIDIEYELSGILEGTLFSDFFSIEWQDAGSELNFSMHIKDGLSLEKLISQIRIKNVIVSLRANLNCDIDVLVQNGNVAIEVIYGITVGSIFTNISSGNIQYNFTNSFLEGNLTGIVQETGNIKLKTIDVEYKKDSLWTLNADIGNIVIEIDQDKTMGANVTGTVMTNIGNYRLGYLDNRVDVSAHFVLWANPEDAQLHQRLAEIVGFEQPVLNVVNGIDVYTLNSNDYPALYNLNLSFSLPNGYYDIDLQNN